MAFWHRSSNLLNETGRGSSQHIFATLFQNQGLLTPFLSTVAKSAIGRDWCCIAFIIFKKVLFDIYVQSIFLVIQKNEDSTYYTGRQNPELSLSNFQKV